MLSYSANSYCTYPAFTGYRLTLMGPMGIGDSYGQTFHDGARFATTPLSTVNKPAETILLFEKSSKDVVSYTSGTNANLGNVSGYGANNMLTAVGNFGWGLTGNNLLSTSRSGPAFETGENGAVSVPHLETSNFLFTDGHVKAMRPLATVVSGNNMWDALR